MDAAEYTLIALNAAMAFSIGWPLATRLSRVTAKPEAPLRRFGALLALYLIECVAVAASMGTNLFTVALALVWGVVFGLALRRSESRQRQLVKTALLLSLYSSLPVASLASIPLLCALGPWSVLSVEHGARFGIPHFVPWPLNTILGFFLVVTLVAVVLKVGITTTLAGTLIRCRKEHLQAAQGLG